MKIAAFDGSVCQDVTDMYTTPDPVMMCCCNDRDMCNGGAITRFGINLVLDIFVLNLFLFFV
jgi:hypothetical protein